MAVRSFEDMTPAALAIVSLAIVVAIGAIVMTELRPVSLDENSFTNEAHQPTATNGINTTSGFQQYTLDNPGQTVTSLTVTFQNSTGSNPSNTTLTGGGTNYSLNENNGQVNVTKVDDYDSSLGSKFFNDYDNEASGDATGVVDTTLDALRTFADFFVVIIVVVVAALLFIALRVMRMTGARTSV